MNSVNHIIKNVSMEASSQEVKKSPIQDLSIDLLAYIFNLIDLPNQIADGSAVRLVCKEWKKASEELPIMRLRQKNFPLKIESLKADQPISMYVNNIQLLKKMENFIQSDTLHPWIESLTETRSLQVHEINFLLNNLWLTNFSVDSLAKVANQSSEINAIVANLKAKNIKIYKREDFKHFLKDNLPIAKVAILEGLRLGVITLDNVEISQRDLDICLAAVTQDGAVLGSVPENMKTEAICLAAVTEDGWALRFVPENMKTEAICLAAVTQHGEALRSVPENMKTEAICLAAVTQDGSALRSVPKDMRTEAICLAAVTQYGEALRSVPRYENRGDLFGCRYTN